MSMRMDDVMFCSALESIYFYFLLFIFMLVRMWMCVNVCWYVVMYEYVEHMFLMSQFFISFFQFHLVLMYAMLTIMEINVCCNMN